VRRRTADDGRACHNCADDHCDHDHSDHDARGEPPARTNR
jgi:hypothetical protein